MKRFFFHDPYLLIYGFVIVFFGSYGQTFYIALFNEDIRNFYNLTDGQFGFVYAVATLVSSFLFINFAKLIDKIELRISRKPGNSLLNRSSLYQVPFLLI